MAATLLKGREVSAAVTQDLAAKIRDLSFTPAVAFIRIGDDPASVSYVRSKDRMAASLGVQSQVFALPADTSQDALLELIADLNARPDLDGILVQLPLPDHFEVRTVLEAIDPDKDVDGLHVRNAGRLWRGEAGLFPCTPLGLIRILDYYELPIEGRHVVIVGRSNLVGKPAAALFLRRNATVSIAHSRTRDLAGLTAQADILVAAAGRAGMIQPDMVRAGAVVLDVGITRVDGKLTGDVHPEVEKVASYLTPMPGGTGPMTVAMLMHNTYRAALLRRGPADVRQ
ncbi:MAG: tetrahydrofolate dehydrogenase/cyclohydrolase catalytic domain-containing protein [Trueperaceae bacterium]|nr:tetrahydrofolate dehydrogenase/cyclohydrolase catalytic domain-containing protein [Trueperaceae bacterium]